MIVKIKDNVINKTKKYKSNYRNIKDNIRNQGISVTDLYNNLETFTFIHTERLYKQDAKEVQKWDDMFKRISTKDVRGVKRRN